MKAQRRILQALISHVKQSRDRNGHGDPSPRTPLPDEAASWNSGRTEDLLARHVCRNDLPE